MNKYADAIAELNKLIIDAENNRATADPNKTDGRWDGFIRGIEKSIFRLKLNAFHPTPINCHASAPIKIDTNMTNSELQNCIVQTNEMINNCAENDIRYKTLCSHLEFLIANQKDRLVGEYIKNKPIFNQNTPVT